MGTKIIKGDQGKKWERNSTNNLKGKWGIGVALSREQEGDKYRIWREGIRMSENATGKHIVL